MEIAIRSMATAMRTEAGAHDATAKGTGSAARVHEEIPGARGAKEDAPKDVEKPAMRVTLTFTDEVFLVPRKVGLLLRRAAIAASLREADADECDYLGFGYMMVGDSDKAAEYFDRGDKLRELFRLGNESITHAIERTAWNPHRKG